jgi:hypothetical protein
LNTALKRYADAQQLVYLDYYTPMANAAGGLDPQLADDRASHREGCRWQRRWPRRRSSALHGSGSGAHWLDQPALVRVAEAAPPDAARDDGGG